MGIILGEKSKNIQQDVYEGNGMIMRYVLSILFSQFIKGEFVLFDEMLAPPSTAQALLFLPEEEQRVTPW